MSDGFVSIPLAPAPERVPIPAPSPSPSDNTTVTGKETKETRIDRIKRLSTSFFRSGGAGGVNGERRRASSTSTGTSTSTLGDSSTEAEGHGHGHGNAGASSIDKFMGSSPFSVIVVGGAGSGKASLVDRVFGVARVARNAVLVADPQTPLPDDPAAAAATVTLSAKQLKMLDVVRVTGFDAVAEVVALSAADVARIDADICWYFADPHFESDKRVDDTPGDRKHNTHNDENNNYDNDNKYNTLDSAFAAVDALAIRRLLDARVPVLIVLTHADLLPQEKQNAVRNHIASLLKPSDNWDFAPVANPPPPVCSGNCPIVKQPSY
ncbi:hypothetical protein HK100_011357 [Physocladia obscura]|uniref:Uncharacterized protein n=1 Tax=Physocladia obscura TaxID=109957 RepID=A0AAD5T1H8_9FUNG|nr:hypothetical protein HK100_011357 [Physocladia obscura]